MKSYNDDFYNLFNEIADLMSLLDENSFKIRAYREAAMRIKQDFRPITIKDADKKILKEIPRVGDAIAEKMIQYMKEGKIDYLEKLRKQIPKAVRDLLKIPHLGPKRVRDLYINLGIKSKADLKKHAESGKISELPGFGDKLIQSILDGLKTGQEKKKRHFRKEVKPIADKLVGILEKIRGIKKVTVAGSYRRKSPTVGDLDILVCGASVADTRMSRSPTVGDLDILVCGASVADKAEKSIKESFTNISTLASGDTKIAFMIFPDNLQVDIRFVPEESYGAALLYFTGSKDYNVMMRKVAIEKGYLLNEYGLFENGEYIAGKTEKEVCKKLGLPVLEPEKRK